MEHILFLGFKSLFTPILYILNFQRKACCTRFVHVNFSRCKYIPVLENRIHSIMYLTAVNYTTGRVDFNDSVHIVTVPAGQRVDDITVDIPIIDDDIDEADEGFVILLEAVDPAVAPFVDLSTHNTTLGRIYDNDSKLLLYILVTYDQSGS